MSYILDALKKADAERERGSVPGLHSQPLGQVEDDDDDGGGRQAMPPVVWLGAGVGLCLIAVLGWQLLASSKKDEAAVVASTPVGEPAPMQQPMQPPMPQDMPPPVPQQPAQQPAGHAMQAPPPSYAPPPSRMPTPQPQTSQPLGNEAARPEQEAHEQRPAQPPPLTRGNRSGSTDNNSSNATAAATNGQPRATAGERIPTAAELPDDVRHSLPQLTIGGAMYSDTPANRMLIVNSQVFHEGDQPYQGLVLEEIKLKSAVFRYKGYRYAINY